jgi:hypothetical protein
MSMLGPVTCSALTVIDPVFPPGELVCSLTIKLIPPGNDRARFGLDVRTDWPAATSPTSWAFPVTDACVPLQVALEFDFTKSAVIKPPKRFRLWTDDCDWLVVPLPEVELLSVSAEAKPATLTLATDVLRLPPLAGSAPVSDRVSETPAALAFSATASPLNVVLACAKLTTGPKAKIAVSQVAIIEFFRAFIYTFSFFELKLKPPKRARPHAGGIGRAVEGAPEACKF